MSDEILIEGVYHWIGSKKIAVLTCPIGDAVIMGTTKNLFLIIVVTGFIVIYLACHTMPIFIKKRTWCGMLD